MIAIEVGLAFGISSLYILEAMQELKGAKLIGMDPAQFDSTWQGAGLFNIARAGFSSGYEFHGNASQEVLPQLWKEGVKIEFAFIDGWHTFDHTLVDFFYIDEMLNEGGIVVFDDVSYPSIRKVCHFIVTNRAYRIYDKRMISRKGGLRSRAKNCACAVFGPLVRTDETPGNLERQRMRELKDVYFLALQKQSHDLRSFDHFVPF